MINCRRVRSLMEDPGIPSLSAEMAEEVFDHIARCEPCFKAFERAALVDSMVADAILDTPANDSLPGAISDAQRKARWLGWLRRSPGREGPSGSALFDRRSVLKLAGSSAAGLALGAAGYAETKARWPGTLQITTDGVRVNGASADFKPGTVIEITVTGRSSLDWSLYAHSDTFVIRPDRQLPAITLSQGPAVVSIAAMHEGAVKHYSGFFVLEAGRQALTLVSTLDKRDLIARRQELLLRVSRDKDMFDQCLAERVSVSLFANVRVTTGPKTLLDARFDGGESGSPRGLLMQYAGAGAYISNNAQPPQGSAGCLVSCSYPNWGRADGIKVGPEDLVDSKLAFEADFMVLNPRQPAGIGLVYPYIEEKHGWDSQGTPMYAAIQSAFYVDEANPRTAVVKNVVTAGPRSAIIGLFEPCRWHHLAAEGDFTSGMMAVSFDRGPTQAVPMDPWRGKRGAPRTKDDYLFSRFTFGGGNWLPMLEAGA